MATIKDATLDAMVSAEERWNVTTQEMLKLAMAYVLFSQGINEGTVRYNASMIRDMMVTHRATLDFIPDGEVFVVKLEPREPATQERLPV